MDIQQQSKMKQKKLSFFAASKIECFIDAKIGIVEERNDHSRYRLFPKGYLVNMLGLGIKSKGDAHLMRPSDIARAWKYIINILHIIRI